MKKTLLVLTFISLFFTSCGDGKKEEINKETETKVEKVNEDVKEVKNDATASDEIVALGEKLFTDKTCVSCHQADTKIVGPAIKEIIKVYEDKNGNIIQFLKGVDAAIVDTDPGQVAIMKANLDGFVKDLSDNELQALAAYMESVK
jgi:cytochrome c